MSNEAPLVPTPAWDQLMQQAQQQGLDPSHDSSPETTPEPTEQNRITFELLLEMFPPGTASHQFRLEVLQHWARFAMAYAHSGLGYEPAAANADLLTIEYYKRMSLILSTQPTPTTTEPNQEQK